MFELARDIDNTVQDYCKLVGRDDIVEKVHALFSQFVKVPNASVEVIPDHCVHEDEDDTNANSETVRHGIV